MTTKLLHILIILSTLSGYPMMVTGQQLKNDSIKNIQFIPEEFNEIELGDSSTRPNPCTPIFPDNEVPVNSITINTPKKIICNIGADTISPVVPVCMTIDLTYRRSFKYDNKPMTFHMKMEGYDKVYSGVFFEKKIIDEGIIFGWDNEDYKRRVTEAQKYSDAELDEDEEFGGDLNLNIMEYVKMPFLPGKYEVWCTFRGLTSNHCHFEIIAKKFKE